MFTDTFDHEKVSAEESDWYAMWCSVWLFFYYRLTLSLLFSSETKAFHWTAGWLDREVKFDALRVTRIAVAADMIDDYNCLQRNFRSPLHGHARRGCDIPITQSSSGYVTAAGQGLELIVEQICSRESSCHVRLRCFLHLWIFIDVLKKPVGLPLPAKCSGEIPSRIHLHANAEKILTPRFVQTWIKSY